MQLYKIRDKNLRGSDSDSGAVELQCHKFAKHNIYGGEEKVLDPTYLAMVPSLALEYLYDLPMFLQNYEAMLCYYMKTYKFLSQVPLRLCECEAERCFGSRIRIAVKEITPSFKHIEFGIFLHPLRNPRIDYHDDNISWGPWHHYIISYIYIYYLSDVFS